MAFATEYTTDKIRNVVVLGHGGAGKTSLIDALCYTAGSSRRKGDVGEGTALTMYTPEEASHGISLQCTPAFCEYSGAKINLLDTPGFMDFVGETLAAIRVADSAVIVVSATSGVEVGTETVWQYAEDRGVPRFFFVSMMDKDHASFERVYQDIKARLTQKVVPVEIPIGEGPDFRGIINLFSERAHIYKAGTEKGEYDEVDVPEELQAKFEEWETELQETLATTDEALLDRYLEEGKITREEAIEAMHKGVASGDIVPLFCGSSEHSYGMQALLKGLVDLCPSPAEAGGETAQRAGMEEEVHLSASDDETFSALIYKTASEPRIGELSYFRVMSGSVSNGQEVQNGESGGIEKLNHLSIPMGKDRFEVAKLHAGDLGVVAKLKNAHTNDTLCDMSRAVILEKIDFPKPEIAMAIRGEGRGDEDKLGVVLPKLHEEDPTFLAEFDPDLHQTIIRGMGELHLAVQMERMKRKYGVAVTMEQPKIGYRETITKEAEGQGRHKKQSGGRGQFGDCWIRLRPRPAGAGYEFVSAIKGGVIPTKFVPSVDKGIQEAADRGVLAGFKCVDFEAQCYDGSYHAVDSSDIAFKLAGSTAFRNVAAKCRPVILEPIIEVTVTTPDDYLGDIMSDINQRRGKVLGMEPTAGRTTVKALVPEAELYKYSTSLRAITQGRAHHSRSFSGYEAVPEQEVPKVIAASKEAAAAS
ncbi:MAG: elongation factor G [Gemmatimonadetes bacterium]|nr:elongation factor G [Gemmatimonadota bacterium]